MERALDSGLEDRPCVDVVPTPFHQVPQVLCDQVRTDVLLTTVSPMDDTGYFSLGTNTDYAHGLAHSGARVILEVNRHMRRVGGNCQIHVSQVAGIVEHNAPLIEVPDAVAGPTDLPIGEIIAGLFDDGDCLQMGIDAVQA